MTFCTKVKDDDLEDALDKAKEAQTAIHEFAAGGELTITNFNTRQPPTPIVEEPTPEGQPGE